MNRQPGPSVRLKLALSYAGFLMLAGTLLMLVVWVFLLRYVPEKIHIQVPAHPGQVDAAGNGSRAPRPLFVPNRRDLERAFFPKAAAALVFLLVFGLVGGWLLAGRMLRPLSRITEATRKAAAGSLSHRIRLHGAGDEFTELADHFDGMLERLERQVEEQQRFAANASHELRTPLAIMQTLLEVAQKNPDRPDQEVLDRLHHVNTRAIQLTEALLLLSRSAREGVRGEDLDLSLLAEEATETLLPLAEKRQVHLEVTVDPSPTVGSPPLLLQLVMNLLHNAIIHNHPGGTVWVTAQASPEGSAITVANTGDVLTPALVSTLCEPFLRGTERIHRDHAGAGLGLAIVRSITRAHQGKLTLHPRDGGGLTVTVYLPLSPRAEERQASGGKKNMEGRRAHL